MREIDLSKIESRPYRPGSFGTAVAHAAAAATVSRSASSKNLDEEAPPAPEACGFATEPVAKDIGGGVII